MGRRLFNILAVVSVVPTVYRRQPQGNRRTRHLMSKIVCLAGGVTMLWTSHYIIEHYDRPILPHPGPEALGLMLLGGLLTLGSLVSLLLSVPERSTRRDSDIPRSFNCPKCGYDLRATPDRCPECGTPVPAGHTPEVGR